MTDSDPAQLGACRSATTGRPKGGGPPHTAAGHRRRDGTPAPHPHAATAAPSPAGDRVRPRVTGGRVAGSRRPLPLAGRPAYQVPAGLSGWNVRRGAALRARCGPGPATMRRRAGRRCRTRGRSCRRCCAMQLPSDSPGTLIHRKASTRGTPVSAVGAGRGRARGVAPEPPGPPVLLAGLRGPGARTVAAGVDHEVGAARRPAGVPVFWSNQASVHRQVLGSAAETALPGAPSLGAADE